jgi:sphingomyelin phosphodiesterase acid-like 3
MPRSIQTTFGIAIMALLVVIPVHVFPQQKPLPGPEKALLSVSDIHFNPFYDPSLMDSLVTTDYRSWEAIFQSSKVAPNGYSSDANYPLLRSAFTAMQKQDAHPGFIIISGDFLCHEFQSKYAAYAGSYPDSLQSFTAKTIRFVAWLLNKYFPTTIVLPVLGNNDSDCGDYKVQPGGWFLGMFARAWVSLQRNGSAAADSSFVTQFSKGGYYTYPFRNGTNARLLMLNTVFFSTGYANSCGNPGADPAGDELNWLDSVMNTGKLKRQSVWMVYHIPPGINVYSSVNGSGSCDSNSTLMWQEPYNSRFLGLVRQHAPRIKAALAGHTHMDDFRVIYTDSIPVSFIHITPAISPLFGNNPGFQRITYNSRTPGLQNAETFYLNAGTPGSMWTPEYNFQKTYGVSAINAASLHKVRRHILTDTVFRNRYIKLYDVSNPPLNGINQQNWKAFWCGTGALTRQDFSACYCR